MRTAVGSSVALHVVAAVISVVGLPHLSRPIDLEEQPPIVAELVTISDVTNVPTRPKEPEPPKEQAKPEPPKPQPAPQKAETPPAPPPKPEPLPQVAAVPPEPKPEAKKEEPKKEEPKPRPPEELAKLKATKKPAPPKEDFDAVLKNLAKAAPKAEPKAEAKKSQPNFDEMMAKALPSNRRNIGDPTKPISMTQKDALQNEFNKAMQRCWNIPAGAKDAATLVITVSASFGPDGTIITAKSDDVNSSDPFRRAAAESAVRALRSCSPYTNLPSIANYDQWRDIDLRFNPKEILGG